MLFEMRLIVEMLELWRGNDDGPELYVRVNGDDSIFCFQTSNRFIESWLSGPPSPDLSASRCKVLSRDLPGAVRVLFIAVLVNLTN